MGGLMNSSGTLHGRLFIADLPLPAALTHPFTAYISPSTRGACVKHHLEPAETFASLASRKNE